MVFEIYGQMQLLLQTLEELPQLSLAANSRTVALAAATQKTALTTQADKSKQQQKQQPYTRPKLKLKRPRARGVFWSTPPNKTPPAVAFPRLSKSLEQQRKGLPAGQARRDVLSVLKAADNVSPLLLFLKLRYTP
jgi:hypothetical protein